MSADMERALLSLHAITNTDVFGFSQRSQLGLDELFEDVSPIDARDALTIAAAAAENPARNDRFASAQAFYLGVKYRRAGGEVHDELRALAASLLRSAGSDASVR